MEKVRLADVMDLVEYEKAREAMRARVIEVKRNRRLSVGENLTFLFENRQTVLFQIQEMVRTERIVDEARIREEVSVYNQLIPGPGELAATLFIEIPELVRMTQEKVRETVNRFQGLDREGVWLVAGASRVPAEFEGGHSKEEKMAAVHYVRFAVPPEGRRALADPAKDVRLVVDHPNYRAEAAVPPGMRKELVADLR